jgi:putative metallohydrolase (TIGR04338 family)
VSPRDSQRARVYAAEEFVRILFDRAAQHNSRAVDFFGTSITLPPEARFASVDSVQRYVDGVLALPGVSQRWPSPGPVRVRSRRAATAAHYESSGENAGVIAVPQRLTADWAMRELVLLHELAHHLCGADGPAHGSHFTAAFCELAATVMGPEAGHVLRVVYAKEGVR